MVAVGVEDAVIARLRVAAYFHGNWLPGQAVGAALDDAKARDHVLQSKIAEDQITASHSRRRPHPLEDRARADIFFYL